MDEVKVRKVLKIAKEPISMETQSVMMKIRILGILLKTRTSLLQLMLRLQKA